MPREAVDRRKIAKIKKTAAYYMSAKNISQKDIRFDVVEVAGKTIEIIKNAFE